MLEAYIASHAGRTCKITAFNFNCAAWSSKAINSAFCSATVKPDFEGQSAFVATQVIHAPRNSRATVGGVSATGRKVSMAAHDVATSDKTSAKRNPILKFMNCVRKFRRFPAAIGKGFL